jgi:CheY-like chemotaxis protein
LPHGQHLGSRYDVEVRKVLVVEDDEDVREAVRVTLEDEGYWVICAADGRQAMEMIRAEAEPCLILLDLIMPVLSGWQFRALQQQDARLARFPVIVITATSTLEEAAISADGVLHKPMRRQELLDAVNAIYPPGDFESGPPTERWAPEAPASQEDSGPHS